jgi:hypothetical protein
VGRAEEVSALVADIDRIAEGGSAMRFIIGDYGSGKTFFLHLVRSIALERALVAAHTDLSPSRRLHATGGEARTLFADLMVNLATRTKPEGGALPSIVERFVTSALQEARDRGTPTSTVLDERLQALNEVPGGYDFVTVIGAYWRGHEEGNDRLQSDATRWLRGEFTTKTDARAALGVRTIIDDASIYDHLRLFARFVRLAGYAGLVVCFDEMVNLYKLANTRARNSNYEVILRIVNDSLQGNSVGLGVLFGGTPDFLLDPRRGLFSYEALRSRLAQNQFTAGGLKDLTGPVVPLPALTPEELFVLLRNLRHVHAGGDPAAYLVPDEGLVEFMQHCSQRVGEAYFRTPRTTIRAFLDLLAVLQQNPGVRWRDLLSGVELAPESNPDLVGIGDEATDAAPAGTVPTDDDDLATFRL